MRKVLILIIVLVALCAGPAFARESKVPAVVVSIKPLHALVAGVMRGVGEPQLLMQGGGSPHGYALRPSQARALAQADLLVWVGEGLEGFLIKPLATLAQGTRQLELADVLHDALLPQRAGGNWEEDAPEHVAGEHDHGAYNPHIWLSPRLAQRIVTQVAATLSEIDPAHREQYQANAARLNERLVRLDAALARRLAPVRAIPYIVFHDAYAYFEAAYGLNAVGSISIDPERRPGARRIGEIRERIRTLQARCVFSEPQFEPRLIATLIEGTGARSDQLDPLGVDLTAGEEAYFKLLEQLTTDLLRGLGSQ